MAKRAPLSLLHHDVQITAEPVQTLDHLGLTDASEFSSQHFRELRLRHPQQRGRPLLLQMPTLDDLTDLVREPSFDEHLVRPGIA